MADRRRGKQRKREEQPEKPSKEEYAVAKYLRFNLPTREGKLVGMTVQCFIATKAVDLLLESKWGGKARKDPLFTSRAGCVDYCNQLLIKGLFHRAARVGKKKEKERERERDGARKKKKLKELKEGEEETKETKEEKAKQEKKNKKKERKREKDKEEDEDTEKDKEKESEGEKEDKKMEERKDEERKKKRKLRLEMHDVQLFKDGDEIYVWIYDPVPVKTFMIGLLLVLGAIAVSMFPLWAPEVRLGIYYLSIAAAGFVGVILVLCVVRLVLFCIVWVLTMGKHHFWFLPNLTEDVGFFDSFKPLYKHDYFGPGDPKAAAEKAALKSGSEEEQKDEKNEDEDEEKEGEQEEEERGSEKDGSVEGSEDNGYEIVDREDLIENEEKGEQEEKENDTDDDEEEEGKESKKTK